MNLIERGLVDGGLARSAPVGAKLERPFTRIAEGGFGDGWNAYAHSMAWFQGALYVGTTRANLCSIKAARPPDLVQWPIRCPDDVYEIDRRAEIWRFDPAARCWLRVFKSPWVEPEPGLRVPREIGYRAMCVFRGRKDVPEALHVLTWSPAKSGRPSMMLRTENGRDFVPVKLLEHDRGINTYRALCSFNGRLFTSPAGRTAGWQGDKHLGVDDCAVGAAVVLENADPVNDTWRLANPPSFGDEGNLTVFDLAVFDDHLYAVTVNRSGFQLWKTDGKGEPPYDWHRVLSEGAYRGPLSEGAATLCAHEGYLYVGTGIQNGGFNRALGVGPASAELLRVDSNDSWELVVGTPRETPDGFRSPISGFGPGFDSFFAGYFWNSCSHDGYLYVGSYDWSVFLSYLPLDQWPKRFSRIFHYLDMDRLADRRAGCDLWRSRDGRDWEFVTRDGFGCRYNYGVRRMVSSPHGLFVGTANPFGPEVACHDASGDWRYVPNPRGGLEIWWSQNGARPENGR